MSEQLPDRLMQPLGETIADRTGLHHPGASDSPAGVAATGEEVSAVVFSLAGGRYALEASHVREVCVEVDYTPIPGTPPYVAGVMSLRGEVIAVMDFRSLLQLPCAGRAENAELVVVEVAGACFGILCDGTLGVMPVPLDPGGTAADPLGGGSSPFIKGKTSEGVVVLDIVKVVETGALLVNGEVSS